MGVVLATPPSKMFLVKKPDIKGYVRRPRFFKNCRATKREREREKLRT